MYREHVKKVEQGIPSALVHGKWSEKPTSGTAAELRYAVRGTPSHVALASALEVRITAVQGTTST